MKKPFRLLLLLLIICMDAPFRVDVKINLLHSYFGFYTSFYHTIFAHFFESFRFL